MKTFDLSTLAQFHGSDQWFRHALMRDVIYTEGVRYVGESAGAYWLIDEIATAQMLAEVKRAEFQHWRLAVDLEARTAELLCDDGNDRAVYSKRIEFTDFPAAEMRFYCVRSDGAPATILLPGEY